MQCSKSQILHPACPLHTVLVLWTVFLNFLISEENFLIFFNSTLERVGIFLISNIQFSRNKRGGLDVSEDGIFTNNNMKENSNLQHQFLFACAKKWDSIDDSTLAKSPCAWSSEKIVVSSVTVKGFTTVQTLLTGSYSYLKSKTICLKNGEETMLLYFGYKRK